MVVKLTIAYDGSKFYGSAIQPKMKTVQGEIKNVLNILGINSKVHFSGRTDKFVHASSQVVSFALPSYWTDMNLLKDKMSKMVCKAIKIKKISIENDLFHARFSAKKRSYRYIISTKELTPFNYDYFHYIPTLDETIINKAINKLIGTYDFEYFSKQGSEPISTIRTIYSIKLYKYKSYWVFKFTANAYLRSQIRMMVDFLLKISNKKLTIKDLEDQIYKKRLVCTTLAPPNGLYLSRIMY